jgi:hypothetical protein
MSDVGRKAKDKSGALGWGIYHEASILAELRAECGNEVAAGLAGDRDMRRIKDKGFQMRGLLLQRPPELMAPHIGRLYKKECTCSGMVFTNGGRQSGSPPYFLQSLL